MTISKQWVILVTGSRSILEKEKIHNVLNNHLAQIEVDGGQVVLLIEGDAIGVDQICGVWASGHNIIVDQMPIPKEYHTVYGAGAGCIRNQDMLDKLVDWRLKGGKCLPVAFWDGSSTGTRDMIHRMRKSGFEPEVYLMGKPKSKRLI